MRLVLDTNEFIAALGLVKHLASESLLEELLSASAKHSIHIPRTIVNEVRRNLPPILFSQFIKIVGGVASIDEDIVVPFDIGAKYESIGLKPADAFIAAYTEWVGADALVTENRHFLTRRSDLPFKVLTAEACLKLLK